MRRVALLFTGIIGVLLISASIVSARPITIKPASPTVALGKTLQFAAQVIGLANSQVTWSAGGVSGGNAKVGIISATGLYKAPAVMPGQNPVQITASSKVNRAIYTTTYVTILTPGPSIISLSPNPLAVGTITVTVQGSGFQPNATVFVSSGKNLLVQMAMLSVTAISITATGYQGPASSASFSVKNPGSAYSNALSVPVTGSTPAPTPYTLTVLNGSGSGSYTAGMVVTISANAPAAGQTFLNWSGATVQNANAASTTLTMPAANTTVTANYSSAANTSYTLTVVNGSGSGSYAAGTVVTISANAPANGQTFLNWSGATVQNINAATTTLSMPAANTTVTANYSTPAQVPFPVSSHPRLWITQNDLPRLQGWATAANPIYAQGMAPLLSQAVNIYTTQYFPNGVANPNYPDPGDVQGYTFYITEQVAVVLAFNSLIDPDPNARITYAQYARNMIMYAMNLAALGHLAGAPFRDPMFAIYNRANGSGEQWPLIVDWIYDAKDAQGNPILSASDKATIRNVFMIWANDCLNASTTGGDHPVPIGVMNDPQLLPNDQPYRMASNNYYLGHARLLTMMALSIDPSDDPPLNAASPAAQLGNTLRSYLLDANGAWLYQEFAMMGDPSTVASAYDLPGNGDGFGLASGGLPPEGMLYGHSFGFILGQLLALQTAGFNNPSYSGPQIGLIGAPVWDRYVTGYMSSLTPTAQVFAAETYNGPLYQFASYGDLLRLWVTPDTMQPFSLLALLDHQNGRTDHDNAARWFAVNVVEGGAGALLSRITDPWSWSSTQSILYFMLFDPAAPAATDPRPTFPTTFVDPAAGRIVAHNNWSESGAMFDYRASWISINHQDGDGGQFELFRKGEWLTKEMSNYDNNCLGMTTMYHNTLALQNWCADGAPNLQWYEAGEWANGSEWMEGVNAGDPTTSTSTGAGYVYAASNLINLFNRPDIWSSAESVSDITQATRSIVWLNNDYIVVYDRATSIHPNLFKRFNLCLVSTPVIAGNTATETLASGQQLFVQSLLPHSPTLSAVYAAGNLNPIADLEPTQYILSIEDATNPADVRFLHVLQGADPGAAMTQAGYLQSAGGVAFDGAAFGSTAVYFPVSANGVFTGTALSAPTGVHTLLVTGLAANTAYGIGIQPGSGGSDISITPGGASGTTDGAGVLELTF